MKDTDVSIDRLNVVRGKKIFYYHQNLIAKKKFAQKLSTKKIEENECFSHSK